MEEGTERIFEGKVAEKFPKTNDRHKTTGLGSSEHIKGDKC